MELIINTKFDWRLLDQFVFLSQCHEKQYQFLYNAQQKENLIHAGNGWGKTEVMARRHLSFILKHFDNPEYKTMNVALTMEQASFVLDRIVKMCRESPVLNWMIKDTRKLKNDYTEIQFINGAITSARTLKNKGEAIEGGEYGYISCDEVALERHLEFIREFILLPRMRRYKDSQIDYCATPKGLNAYYRIKQDIHTNHGYVMSGSSYDNPFIDHKHLDYMCNNKSQAYIDQVINGKFIDNSNYLFASRVNQLIDTSLQYESPMSNCMYVDGWDLARGRKGDISDSTVKYTIKIPLEQDGCGYIVDRWKGQIPWTAKSMENENMIEKKNYKTNVEDEVRRSHRYYNNSFIYVDSTGIGDTLFEIVKDIAKGVDFRGMKQKILESLQLTIDQDKLKCPYIPDLIEQMTTYTLKDTELDTDDIMALAIANYGMTQYNTDTKVKSSSSIYTTNQKKYGRNRHHYNKYAGRI